MLLIIVFYWLSYLSHILFLTAYTSQICFWMIEASKLLDLKLRFLYIKKWLWKAACISLTDGYL